jgi:hypothetical protein
MINPITSTNEMAIIIYKAINNKMIDDSLDILRPLLEAWRNEIVNQAKEVLHEVVAK